MAEHDNDKMFDDLNNAAEKPVAGMKVLKRVETSDYEQAYREMKEFGFDYHVQGAEYSSPTGLAVWRPQQNIIIVQFDIVDKMNWFVIEIDPRHADELKHKLSGMAKMIEEVEAEEQQIASDVINAAGIEV